MGRNEKTNIPPVQMGMDERTNTYAAQTGMDEMTVQNAPMGMGMKTTVPSAQKENHNVILIAVLAVLMVAIFVIAGCIVANVISERSDPGSGSSKSEPKDPSGKEPPFDRGDGEKPGEDLPATGDVPGEEQKEETKPGEIEETKPGEIEESKPGETEESNPGETEETKPGEIEESKPGEIEQSKPEETEPTQPTEQPEAFYGIWCAAYETREQAEPILLDLVGNGFRAQIHLTTSWSELNPKPYYVVTAGEYASYEEAEADLLQVQSFFPGAYIKYTGYWQGP